MSRTRLLAALVLPLAFVAGSAMAAPVVIGDNVAVAAVKSGNTNFEVYGYTNEPSFEGYRDVVNGKNYYWGDVVGNPAEYDAESITINRDNTAGTITFTLKTKFDGSGLGGTERSDWFFDTLTPTTPDSFNYAIVLGSDKTRGGLAAGLYEVGQVQRSVDVWAGTSGYGIGGLLQFCGDDPNDPGTCDYSTSPGVGLAPPTLLETGNKIGDVAVNVTNSGGWYYVSAVVSGVNLNLFNQFDILATSADCANDALWGEVVTESVPAPGALLLIGMGLLGMGLLRRRAAA